MLEHGQKVPNFCLLGDDSKEYRLESFKGQKLVLFFYPKDSTPGCTLEAKDFSVLSPRFEELGARVVGVSKDSISSHANFKCKHSLGVLLLSDPEVIVHKNFSAIKNNSIFGKTALAVIRSTFLIDEKGILLKSWYKVRVKDHANVVLEAVKKLPV